ncbi:MAG: arrestin family protein [Verrucomicrobia bacterium]|jgi:hypothetical protein|nr:arrestin family protein [Verrucomicrobiota bacterium]
MKIFNPVLGLLLLTPLTPLPAQVVVEVTIEQEQFLPGETLPVAVKIKNRSGQTLHMGREADWLTLSVESRDGLVVAKSGEAPVTGEFTVESSQVATKQVDLSPYFALTRPGRYSVIATVRIKEWDGQATSAPKPFDIINGAKLWSQDFGVPAVAGATNQPPEIRRYTLLQANYLRKQLRLYLRLTDDSEGRVFKVVTIGPLVGLSRPEQQVDQFSHLHVLYQNGAHTFSYTVINPDGEIIVRQTHDYVSSRPRLRPGKDGRIVVAGGARRVTDNDLPAPKKNEDEPKPPKS